MRASRLNELLRRFRRQNQGNMAMMFALLLVPIMAAVGSAVDFGMANMVRTELQAAADAAAVGSVAKSSPAMQAASSMNNDGSIPAGVTDALNIFNAQVATRTGFTNAKPKAKVVKTKGSVTSTVSFTAKVPTRFMGLFGKNNISISGSSTATNGTPLYADFYLLLDNTPSMGVGATPADIATMVAHTPDQCAFACHDLSDSNNYYNLAKKLGVQMRIDVLRTATQQLMDTAKNTAVTASQFRVAIYTFGTSCTLLGLNAVASLTSNLSLAKSQAANIDLMTIPYQGYNNDQCTDYDGSFVGMNTAIPDPGDGSTPAKAQKYLFFVSDGVADSNNPFSCSKPVQGGTRCQEPLDIATCTTIKNRGIKIAVLYTTYLPLPTNAWYNTWIKPFTNEIGPQMQACASPGLYFEVSPTQGISEAMNALFQKVVQEAHLTQ
jgi:Flp pilus assembly protein TadG